MRFIFAPLATADLEEIGDYIALDNPPWALSFVRELRAQCRKILDNPLAFVRARIWPQACASCRMANT